MKKNIAILTQPLHDNYGGLLQAFALKETLKNMGHSVVIVDRRTGNVSQLRRFLSYVYKKFIGAKMRPNTFLSKKNQEIISKNTRHFREKYIPNMTPLITTEEGMTKLNNYGFDIYIVGSDQCWRPKYSPAIKNFFLDFAEKERNIKRIAYAASFGVSRWEFNEQDTDICKRLIQKFDGVSVREDSGEKLLKDYLGYNEGIHVVDPTMLLDRQYYIDIVRKENITRIDGGLKTYILDKTDEKEEIIRKIEEKIGLKQFDTLPSKRIQKDKLNTQNIEDFIYPGPLSWIRGYMDAEFVVTDSFHGCVFSIIFNVPFLAIGNESRGLSRFQSLLKMFKLEDRLVTNTSTLDVDSFIERKINWQNVNDILEYEKNKAFIFLNQHIN